MLPFFTIIMTAPAMSSRCNCNGTKPSRKASTSFAVISRGVSGDVLVEGIRDSAGRVGFVTWSFGILGRAARQHRVSTLNVAVTPREYPPIDEIPICCMTIDTSADLNHSFSRRHHYHPIQQAITCTLLDARCQSRTSSVVF